MATFIEDRAFLKLPILKRKVNIVCVTTEASAIKACCIWHWRSYFKGADNSRLLQPRRRYSGRESLFEPAALVTFSNSPLSLDQRFGGGGTVCHYLAWIELWQYGKGHAVPSWMHAHGFICIGFVIAVRYRFVREERNVPSNQRRNGCGVLFPERQIPPLQ